jgi:hypothetical protein
MASKATRKPPAATSRVTRPRPAAAPREARAPLPLVVAPRPPRPIPHHPWFGMPPREVAARLWRWLMS